MGVGVGVKRNKGLIPINDDSALSARAVVKLVKVKLYRRTPVSNDRTLKGVTPVPRGEKVALKVV